MAAIDLTFGVQLSIDYGTKRGIGKRVSNKAKDKIAKFVRSYELGMFCNFHNLPETGCLLQIATARESVAYPLDRDGNYVVDFIISRESEGNRNFKAKRLISRSSCGETEIFHAETYFVWKMKLGGWAAFKILEDDAQLVRAKVLSAVQAYADLKGYDIISKPEVVESGVAKYWRVQCDSFGAKREILVNFDNGKMMDILAGSLDLQPKPVGEGRLLKTKFNHFRYEGNGVFIRS